MMISRWTLVVVLACSVLSCRPEDQRTDTLDPSGGEERGGLSALVTAQLDSANAAYKGGDLERARDLYRLAIEGAPEKAAPWFGLYMAELALGDTAAADAALEIARDRASGASLIHPTPRDTLR
jgi:hypothetical protein